MAQPYGIEESLTGLNQAKMWQHTYSPLNGGQEYVITQDTVVVIIIIVVERAFIPDDGVAYELRTTLLSVAQKLIREMYMML